MVPFTPNRLPMPFPAVDPASRLKPPALIEADTPTASRGDLVMMFTAPDTALAPQTADAGPRTTSICLISEKLVGSMSHRTRPKKSR